MFGGGPAHLGRASGTLADKLEPAWTFKTSGPIKSSPAIVMTGCMWDPRMQTSVPSISDGQPDLVLQGR